MSHAENITAGAPAPSLSKSEVSRWNILDAAAATFRRKGYAATRLTDIAAAANMQAGSIYYHFESKEQILQEVLDIGIRRVFEAVRAEVEAMPAAASHRARLHGAIGAHLTALLQLGDYTSANVRNFDHVPDEVQERNLALRRAYDTYWRRLLEDAKAAGEVHADVPLQLVRMFLLGALNGSIEWYRPGRTPIGQIADVACAMMFDGIGVERA